MPDLENFIQEQAFTDSAYFFFSLPGNIKGLQLRYTLDSSLPSIHSTLLEKKVLIKTDQTIRFALFAQNGRRGDVQNIHYKKTMLMQPENMNVASLSNGLQCNYYKGYFTNTSSIKTKKI